jgi:fumarate reductase (CoM/CoB) subunit A
MFYIQEGAAIRALITDVLVIGCGPAGLLAALEARKKGCRVIAMDKGIIGHDCSAIGAKQVGATGNWSHDGDGPELHAQDILKAGCYINDERLTTVLANRVGRVITELHRIGMPFNRDDSGKQFRIAGPIAGHSIPRGLFFSDITGKMLVDTIYAECRRRGVELYSETMVVDLIRSGDEIVGAVFFEIPTGELILVRAKATVMATGGIGMLYELTSNPAQNTGDGIACAMRAGAEMMDLEFVQFYPVTVLAPQSIRGMNLNSHHYGAQLKNSKGERFMAKYYPEQMEHVTRDKLSQSIFREIMEGNTGPNGGVYMDATMIPGEVYAKEIPSEWNLAVSVGIDLTKDMLEVAPSAHYYMGGIRIDERCKTSVKGLFATGECAAGVQGANRLANSGLGEAVAFGSVAGENAAEYALRFEMPSYSQEDLDRPTGRLAQRFGRDGRQPADIMRDIRKTMTRYVGIVRDQETLEKGLELLDEYDSQRIDIEFGQRWDPKSINGISASNMAVLGKGIALSALERKESRGAHYRADYPMTDDQNWKANVIVTMDTKGHFTTRIEKVGTAKKADW